MGVVVRSYSNAGADLEAVSSQMVDWLMGQKDFALTSRGWVGPEYVVKLSRSGFIRQISGLVYTIEIGLQRNGGIVIARVDDGDLRNQLAAMGLAAFVWWPVIISAGFGWMTKGEMREEALVRLAQVLGAPA